MQNLFLAGCDWSEQYDEDAQSPWQPENRQSCYLAISIDSLSPPPTLFLSLPPTSPHTHNTVPFNMLLRSQDSVCEEMRGNEENREIQDVEKQNIFSKQGREVEVWVTPPIGDRREGSESQGQGEEKEEVLVAKQNIW